MDDMNKGLYQKYLLMRTDGSTAPGGKHHECKFFVLDLTHDPFAIPAIMAYAEACATTHPKLARDLLKMVPDEEFSDRAECDFEAGIV